MMHNVICASTQMMTYFAMLHEVSHLFHGKSNHKIVTYHIGEIMKKLSVERKDFKKGKVTIFTQNLSG